MPLIRLECEGVRNLEATALQPHGRLNLIVGPNASGKTSLLEALYVLGTGKSFRTSQLEKLICHGADDFTVFGVAEEEGRQTRLGYRRVAGGREMHVSGSEVRLTADLARHLPIQAVTPDTHFAFLHQAAARRSMLDWALFHVEPEFFPLWSEYRRILRQRNAALKDSVRSGGYAIWDQALARAGEAIQDYRAGMLEDVARRSAFMVGELLGIGDFSLRLRPGWRREQALAVVLQEDSKRDRDAGYTHSGPHRADIEIHLGQHDARQAASQGQWKALVLSLRLAQLALFSETTNRSSVLLLDDLPAELDKARRQAVFALLDALPIQVFATATSEHEFGFDRKPDCDLFHVEQGRVEAVETA